MSPPPPPHTHTHIHIHIQHMYTHHTCTHTTHVHTHKHTHMTRTYTHTHTHIHSQLLRIFLRTYSSVDLLLCLISAPILYSGEWAQHHIQLYLNVVVRTGLDPRPTPAWIAFSILKVICIYTGGKHRGLRQPFQLLNTAVYCDVCRYMDIYNSQTTCNFELGLVHLWWWFFGHECCDLSSP